MKNKTNNPTLMGKRRTSNAQYCQCSRKNTSLFSPPREIPPKTGVYMLGQVGKITRLIEEITLPELVMFYRDKIPFLDDIYLNLD